MVTQCCSMKLAPKRMSDNPGFVRTYATATKNTMGQPLFNSCKREKPTNILNLTTLGCHANQPHQIRSIVRNERLIAAGLSDECSINNNCKYDEGVAQVSRNNTFKNFLYDINVDSLTGYFHLYIYVCVCVCLYHNLINWCL